MLHWLDRRATRLAGGGDGGGGVWQSSALSVRGLRAGEARRADEARPACRLLCLSRRQRDYVLRICTLGVVLYKQARRRRRRPLQPLPLAASPADPDRQRPALWPGPVAPLAGAGQSTPALPGPARRRGSRSRPTFPARQAGPHPQASFRPTVSEPFTVLIELPKPGPASRAVRVAAGARVVLQPG